MNFKRILSILFIFLGIGLMVMAVMYFFGQGPTRFIHPLSVEESPFKQLPLKNYSFESLKHQPDQPSQINVDGTLPQEPDTDYTARLFSYTTNGKNMTGQINIPNTATPSAGFPVILMLRGFVDPSIYQTGIGTKNGAAYFAQNGFVTIAPDFLGYGGSDNPDPDALAARVHKPKNIINLISSLQSLKFINPEQLAIWAHSNGGQIALSVLEITGKPYPTTLWAPVSKSFPYSILYYTDEYDDQGKALRKSLALFEEDYDAFDYSIDKYWSWITAPIMIHQGTADDAVPYRWSQELNSILKSNQIDVAYHEYPAADHDLRPSWSTVIARDLDFFSQQLQLNSPKKE